MDRVFITGAPGSRWSGIAQEIKKDGNYNMSDRTSERQYQHHGFSGHKGAYFGTGMEFPAILDTKNLNLPYGRKSTGTKLHKSHEWSLMLDDITDLYHRSGIILIYRPDDACFSWWQEAGGFNINYPNYSHYENETKMKENIKKQNDAILKFSHKHNLIWKHHHKHHDVLIAKKFPK